MPASTMDEFNDFESVEEIQEMLDLLADKQQAEAVLRIFVANTSPDVIHDAEDIRRLRLSSGLSAGFDARYLWDQFSDLADSPSSAEQAVRSDPLATFFKATQQTFVSVYRGRTGNIDNRLDESFQAFFRQHGFQPLPFYAFHQSQRIATVHQLAR